MDTIEGYVWFKLTDSLGFHCRQFTKKGKPFKRVPIKKPPEPPDGFYDSNNKINHSYQAQASEWRKGGITIAQAAGRLWTNPPNKTKFMKVLKEGTDSDKVFFING